MNIQLSNTICIQIPHIHLFHKYVSMEKQMCIIFDDLIWVAQNAVWEGRSGNWGQRNGGSCKIFCRYVCVRACVRARVEGGGGIKLVVIYTVQRYAWQCHACKLYWLLGKVKILSSELFPFFQQKGVGCIVDCCLSLCADPCYILHSELNCLHSQKCFTAVRVDYLHQFTVCTTQK
jgi:hypothetical protein